MLTALENALQGEFNTTEPLWPVSLGVLSQIVEPDDEPMNGTRRDIVIARQYPTHA